MSIDLTQLFFDSCNMHLRAMQFQDRTKYILITYERYVL